MLKGKRSVTPSRFSGSDNHSNSPKKKSTTSISSMDHPNSNNGVHWNDLVQETVLSATYPDQLYFSLSGGADEGQFPHVGDFTVAHPEDIGVNVRGHGLSVGDVILDIQGQKVSGFTGHDVQETLKQCLSNGKMVVVRAIPQGKTNDISILKASSLICK